MCHEGVEDQRMRDPPEEFSAPLDSHPSGAAGQPAVPKPWGQVTLEMSLQPYGS